VQAPKPLDGLGFGAGLALSIGQPRVSSAVAVGPNKIVRVTDGSNALAGIVFESHYFFVPPASHILGSQSQITWGYGPFVAVDASTSATSGSTVVAGISLGWMVGFRRLDVNSSQTAAVASNNSWNFGVGLRVDPKATVLGSGIVGNQPLPAGETNPEGSSPRHAMGSCSSLPMASKAPCFTVRFPRTRSQRVIFRGRSSTCSTRSPDKTNRVR
jgi:hypothetical protein